MEENVPSPTTTDCQVTSCDPCIPNMTLSVIKHLHGLFSERKTAELENAKLHYSANNMTRALHCLSLSKEYESKLERLRVCKRKTRYMRMLLRAEETAASASSSTPTLLGPSPSESIQGELTNTSDADMGKDSNHQQIDCAKPPGLDAESGVNEKPRDQMEGNMPATATADQIQLCMRLATNAVLHSAFSKQIDVELDHVNYYYGANEISRQFNHTIKKTGYEGKVYFIEESDASIFNELKLLGVENIAARWRQLLGSGAALIEAVEEVINTDNCYERTCETGRQTGCLKSFLEMQLPSVVAVPGLNETPVVPKSRTRLDQLWAALVANLGNDTTVEDEPRAPEWIAAGLDDSKLHILEKMIDAANRCLKKENVAHECCAEKLPVIKLGENISTTTSEVELRSTLAEIQALQSNFCGKIALASEYAKICQDENDKFCTMKLLEDKADYESKLKELKECRRIIRHRLKLLDGENVVSGAATQ